MHRRTVTHLRFWAHPTKNKVKRWRFKGELDRQVLEQYCATKPELNVLPYCSQFIPMEVIEFPKHQSIVYHPSILPRHRGASAINWTLIEGEPKRESASNHPRCVFFPSQLHSASAES